MPVRPDEMPGGFVVHREALSADDAGEFVAEFPDLTLPQFQSHAVWSRGGRNPSLQIVTSGETM